MSQSDISLADQTGYNYVQSVNAALQALATDFSGNSEPSETFPYMKWRDTSVSPSVLKIRNATNTAWTTETVTLPATGIVAGTYKSLTVGEDGRATGGTNPTTLAGFGITDGVNSVTNITNLRSYTGTDAFIQTAGYYSAGDGGGSIYRRDSSDVTSADDGCTVIVGTSSTRWKLVANGTLSIKQFGAVADGVTDTTAQFNKFVQVISGTYKGVKGYIPAGKYRLTSRVTFDNSCEIYGDGWKAVRDITGTTTRDWTQRVVRGTIIFADYLTSHDPYVFFVTAQNVTIRDMEFEMLQPSPGTGWVPNDTPFAIYAYRAPYAEEGGNDLMVRNVMLRNCFNGIKMFGTLRGELDGIYGQCFNSGIDVDGSTDVTRISNVHLNWHFFSGHSAVTQYVKTHCEAIKLGKIDNPFLHNIFVFQAYMGVHAFISLDATPNGGGSLIKGVNIGLDDVVFGVVTDDSVDVDFTNLYVYCDSSVSGSRCVWSRVVRGGGYTPVRLKFSSCDFIGSNEYNMDFGVTGIVALSNIRNRTWSTAGSGFSAIRTTAPHVLLSNVFGESGGSSSPLLTRSGAGVFSGEVAPAGVINSVTVTRTYEGTCDSSGNAIFSHGVTSGASAILLAQCYCKTSSGVVDAKMMTFNVCNDAAMSFVAGVAGMPYRATVVFNPVGNITSW